MRNAKGNTEPWRARVLSDVTAEGGYVRITATAFSPPPTKHNETDCQSGDVLFLSKDDIEAETRAKEEEEAVKKLLQ